MSNNFAALLLVSLFCLAGCTPPAVFVAKSENTPVEEIVKLPNPGRIVHVMVALCDNENQGIVPVPSFLGNGEDAAKNLYWGAAFGVKTFFGKSASWQKLATVANPKENVLERIVFKHRAANVYLVADAYRGSRMRETINDFLAAAAGRSRENVALDHLTL